MRSRTLEQAIDRAITTFPAIIVTGPRQSGKTTLLRNRYGTTHRYLTLENLDTRDRALNDPIGFLKKNPPPIIIDEIQYAPQLLSYIKTLIDENRQPGNWLLTGSQNFTLMKGVTQSLAGRAAVLTLLPFSTAEIAGITKESESIDRLLSNLPKGINPSSKTISCGLDQLLFRGEYPEISLNNKIDRDIWCNSYLSTYLERDIRDLEQVGDLNQFKRFVQSCAVRTGQILNYSSLANDIGISPTTARRWLSILEASYQILLIYPFYKNIGKRIVKSPKLYFTSPGLASYLMGFSSWELLENSPYYGALFETMIVVDFWKRFLHHGQASSLYYLRTRDGLEIDLVIENNARLHLFEIKSSSTIMTHHAQNLIIASRTIKADIASINLVSTSPESFSLSKGIYNYNWQDLLIG